VKTIDSELLAVYQGSGPTIVATIMITRTDGQVFRWISLDRDLTIDGHVYEAAPGFDVSSIVSTEGFAVDNAEVKVLEGDAITRADILAGIWDGAAMEIAEVDWKAVTPTKNVLKAGRIGNFTAMRGYCKVEFRDLRQAIQNPRETVLQATCRYKLGDAKCTVSSELSPLTVTGAVTSTASQYSVTDTSRAEPDDFFGEGSLTFTSGANAGLKQKVKQYTASTKTFVFWQQFVYPIGVGDTYTTTAGCRLRFQEDCVGKFDNAINFGGEPNKLNPDVISAPAWVATGATVPSSDQNDGSTIGIA